MIENWCVCKLRSLQRTWGEPSKEGQPSKWNKRVSHPVARPTWVVEANRKKVDYKTSPSSCSPGEGHPGGYFPKLNSIIGTFSDFAFTRLIFLDIDGTINHPDKLESPRTVICRECVQQLSRIIKQASCKIVLSSSWRLNRQLKKTLFTYLRAAHVEKGVMVGETRDLSSQNKTRTEEIKDWLLNPNLYKEGVSALKPWQIESWVSLDDMDLKGMEAEQKLKSNHITIDPQLGLCKTNGIVSKVVQALINKERPDEDKWRKHIRTVSESSEMAEISRISTMAQKTIEDIQPHPETIPEDKSEGEQSWSENSSSEERSDFDTMSLPSISVKNYYRGSTSRKGSTIHRFNETERSVFLCEEWLNACWQATNPKAQESYGTSRSATKSCEVLKSRSTAVNTSRPSISLRSCNVDVNEKQHAEGGHIASAARSSIVCRRYSTSYAQKMSISRSSLASTTSHSQFGDSKTGNLDSIKKLSDKGSPKSVSKSNLSVFLLGDCILDNEEGEGMK